MGFGVTVAIATYGDGRWRTLARERAMPSALDQAPVVLSHADTLADARNRALRSVETEWVIHLDADDELEPGYIDAMAEGTADLRAPAVRYVNGDRSAEPRVPMVVGHNHECSDVCLDDGNWLAIGTAARTRQLLAAGGWRDWPVYEDWDLWRRCHQQGCTSEPVPGAVYRAHVRANSRNQPSMQIRRDTFQAILAA